MTITEDETDYALLRDALERANPIDDDVAEVAILIRTVDRLVDYIESLPCECALDAGPPSDWDVEPCARCVALNRAQNHHPDSGRWLDRKSSDSEVTS